MNDYMRQLEEENEKLRKALAAEIKKKEAKKENKIKQNHIEDIWIPIFRP